MKASVASVKQVDKNPHKVRETTTNGKNSVTSAFQSIDQTKPNITAEIAKESDIQN